jgi:hypothetical protein
MEQLDDYRTKQKRDCDYREFDGARFVGISPTDQWQSFNIFNPEICVWDTATRALVTLLKCNVNLCLLYL